MTEELEAHLRRQVEHSQRFFWHRLRWNVVRGFLPNDEKFELVDVGGPIARHRVGRPRRARNRVAIGLSVSYSLHLRSS